MNFVTHGDLGVCRLDEELHRRTCNYWYTVTSGSMAHVAFHHRHHLDNWLKERGLTLGSHLKDSEWNHARVVGSYRTTAAYSDEQQAAFHALDNFVETRVLSNGRYTLGKIVADGDGIKTVWYLNPNVKDRVEYDYEESRRLVG